MIFDLRAFMAIIEQHDVHDLVEGEVLVDVETFDDGPQTIPIFNAGMLLRAWKDGKHATLLRTPQVIAIV